MKDKPKQDTSWGKVANWYDKHLDGEDNTYQSSVILPNLLRLLNIQKGDKVLDLACGQGFFSRAMHDAGAIVIGSDISKELIEIAIEKSSKEIKYFVSPSDKIPFTENNTIDKMIIVLAIQNIEKVTETFAESARVLKKGGTFLLILNHPAFRIPKHSAWDFDERQNIQFRRLDSYMSENRIEISMSPGSNPNLKTLSFHRPLQYYFKLFHKHGFAVMRLEEWISDKKSEKGSRQKAEDRARREFPLFIAMELKLL